MDKLQSCFVHKEEYYCLEDCKWSSGDCNAQALNPSILLLFKENPWDLQNSTTTLSCYQDKMNRCVECSGHVFMLWTNLHIESWSKLLAVHEPSVELVNNQMCIYICFFTRKTTSQCFDSELINLLSWKGQQTHFLDWCAHCPTLDMVYSWFIQLPGKNDLTSPFCEYFSCALLLIARIQMPQRSLYFFSHLLYIFGNSTTVSM